MEHSGKTSTQNLALFLRAFEAEFQNISAVLDGAFKNLWQFLYIYICSWQSKATFSILFKYTSLIANRLQNL